jgi:putative Flp pilus-assembly TadE/G-like protein
MKTRVSQHVRRVNFDGRDRGEVSIFVVLAIGVFLFLFVGFGVDLTNLFLHRQMAQGAADAACMAGAMDMLANQTQNANMGGAGFVHASSTGTSYLCNQQSATAPCQYAALNGYKSPGLATEVESNEVRISFPASIPGVSRPDPKLNINYPFLQVEVNDRIRVHFRGWLSGSRTEDARALAKCGLVTSWGPVPMLILDPTEPQSFTTGGNPLIQIVGGPTRSIQVNSSSAQAANIFGSAQVDLTGGGPNFNGSSFGVWGGPAQAPGGFQTNPPASWQSPATPIPDPLRLVPPPQPGGTAAWTEVNYHQFGCPDLNGCLKYSAGDWPTGIRVGSNNNLGSKKTTAIFDPGVYYVGGFGLDLGAGSVVRPSDIATASGDGSRGTIFYLTGGGTIQIGANSGKTVVDPFDTSLARCPGDSSEFWAALKIPATIDGNVLVAPCTKDGTYPFAPQGLGIGPDRGILFFQDRSTGVSTTLNGGGGLMLVGAMYFHNCPDSLTTGCDLPPADYQTALTLVGTSGSHTRLIGQIITDQLSMRGTSAITMYLSPDVRLNLLKAALLQ